MRRVALLTIAGLVLGAATVVAAAPAGATPPGGTYVPLAAQSRVVDTRTGAGGNHRGAVAGGHGIRPAIAGKGAVPASGVAAVVVTISAVSPTASGGIVGYVGRRPGTTDLQFTKGHTATGTAILPLSSGRVTLFNTAASGRVHIVVDVSGYYRSGTASATDPGVFHTVTPKRAVDTVRGVGGNHKGALPAGHGISPKFTASNSGVPAVGGAVAVVITALNVRKAGSIIGYRPDEPKQGFALLHFVPGQRSSAFVALRVSGGQASLVNTSAGSVDITVDVVGYYNIGFAQTASAFQTVVPTRAPNRKVGANRTSTVNVAGLGGVPRSGVAAVLVTLHVVGPTRSGGLQVYRYGTTRPRTTTVLQFGTRQTTSNVVLAPVSGGKFVVHNSSPGSETLVVDIDGYVPSTAVPAPTTKATARYLTNVGSSAMSAAGKADAGKSFVLLDIGAQLNDKSGVQLTHVNKNVSYASLVAGLNAYVAGFAARGGRGTIALGTNNAGKDWTHYTATQRGTDWAHKVVDAVAGRPGVAIAGADDLEAEFDSTEPQAAQWKTAFLATTKKSLIYNGSADFCPKTWTNRAACNFGWTYQKLYQLAGGPRTSVLPQIYFGYMATEWAEIDATGGGKLHFVGALTEYASTRGSLQPAQGYTALRRALSSVTGTPPGSLAADIHM